MGNVRIESRTQNQPPGEPRTPLRTLSFWVHVSQSKFPRLTLPHPCARWKDPGRRPSRHTRGRDPTWLQSSDGADADGPRSSSSDGQLAMTPSTYLNDEQRPFLAHNFVRSYRSNHSLRGGPIREVRLKGVTVKGLSGDRNTLEHRDLASQCAGTVASLLVIPLYNIFMNKVFLFLFPYFSEFPSQFWLIMVKLYDVMCAFKTEGGIF